MTTPLARSALLVDLDDTLYEYEPADRVAREAVFSAIAADLGRERSDIEIAWRNARSRVKARLGTRASSHSRLLYLMDLAHQLGSMTAVARVRAWERTFWDAYLHDIRLRAGALTLLRSFRARGGRIAIVTDLTLAPQLEKIAAFKLFEEVDAIVASEEVEGDKPARAIFDLALARLGARGEDCVVVGDSEEKDGVGARAIGAAFHLVRTPTSNGRGETLEQITQEICA